MGFDDSAQGEVLILFNDLRERMNLVMIIITHILHVVHDVTDRMSVMYLGRIVEFSETESMFRASAHPYTAELLSANLEPYPDKGKERISLPKKVPFLLTRPSGCEFHARCPWVQSHYETKPPFANGEAHNISCHYPFLTGTSLQEEQMSV